MLTTDPGLLRVFAMIFGLWAYAAFLVVLILWADEDDDRPRKW